MITGAGSAVGAACARNLARRAQGGLILVDGDQQAMEATADSLRTPPERVSMLALDAADGARWLQAVEFIKAQYGRLDWAIANAPAPAHDFSADQPLVDWREAVDLNALTLTAEAAMSLMRLNTQGGAVVLTAAQAPLDGEHGLLERVAALAAEAKRHRVRVNAVVPGGDGLWRRDAPVLHEVLRESGEIGAALEALARLSAPLVRYSETKDITRLVGILLSDDSPISGATFVADSGPPL
jgi:NAD(P)-dependent dehydrogenase (short-subunit alcohol dehydrogenase family)